MRLRLDVENEGAPGPKRYRLVGDQGAYFWLLSAAGNARDGMTGNAATLEDGSVLELVPELTNEVQKPRHRLAALKADLTGAGG